MDKCIVNLDQCMEVQIIDKQKLSWYQWRPRTVVRNCFGKVKRVLEEGFYDTSCYDEIPKTIEQITEYNDKYIDNKIVYRKPYIKVYYVSGDNSTFYFDTYEEALKVYGYCLSNIKNNYEYIKRSI